MVTKQSTKRSLLNHPNSQLPHLFLSFIFGCGVHTCGGFAFPLVHPCSLLKTCWRFVNCCPFAWLYIEIRGAILNVIPPDLGGPYEHTGPPPAIGGGPLGLPMRSTTCLTLFLVALPIATSCLNLLVILDLVPST